MIGFSFVLDDNLLNFMVSRIQKLYFQFGLQSKLFFDAKPEILTKRKLVNSINKA